MAIVKCIECSGDVSTSAKACPQCGTRKYRKQPWYDYLLSGIILVGFFLLFVLAFQSCSTL